MSKYINMEEVFEMTDKDGNIPEVVVVTSLRTDGKTTGFFMEMIKRKAVFAILYRSFGECKDNHLLFDNAFEILGMERPEMTSKCIADTFYIVYADGEPFCYSMPISKAEQIKNKSSMLSNIQYVVIDEYQSITGRYTKNEVSNVLAIHISIARGINQHTRIVPLFLLGNFITVMNPWTLHYHLEDMKKADADNPLRVIRRNKFIAVNHYNADARQAMQDNGTISATADRKELNAIQGNYMVNANQFIMKKVNQKKFKYICNLQIGTAIYAVRHYTSFIHCSRKPDLSIRTLYTTEADLHNENSYLFTRMSFPCKIMTEYYNNGCLFFDSLSTKNDILEALSISLF